MHCPKDHIPCRTKQLEEITIDVCSQCQGVWIEQHEVRTLVRKLMIPKYTMADELIEKWKVTEDGGTLPKDFWIEDKLECPNGHGHMSKHYFAGSHIGVDQCQTCHGFWLDGGELKAIARDMKPNPQLDRAWQMAIRDVKELNRKMAKLALLPATIAGYAAYVKSMPIALALAGGLLLKFIIEKTIEADKESDSQNL